MMIQHKLHHSFYRHLRNGLVLILATFSLVSYAEVVTVELEIPEIDIAEYHRPYIAFWVENNQRRPVGQIALWLEQEKWHRDLRSWWRRGGRDVALPVDGVSGATRKPGRYTVSADVDLPDGDYSLNIEAVREVGGREHIRIPFTWSQKNLELDAQGDSELGQIKLIITTEDS